MKKTIYCVYDKATAMFVQPFPAMTDSEAVRMLTDVVNDQSTTLSKHPNDYVLYCIASFNDATGLYENCEHKNLGVLQEFVVKSSNLDLFEGEDNE